MIWCLGERGGQHEYKPFSSLLECCAGWPERRVERRRGGVWIDMITIMVCAMLCGAHGWTEIESVGKAKPAWLKGLMALPNVMR
jgi:hypothetical protein